MVLRCQDGNLCFAYTGVAALPDDKNRLRPTDWWIASALAEEGAGELGAKGALESLRRRVTDAVARLPAVVPLEDRILAILGAGHLQREGSRQVEPQVYVVNNILRRPGMSHTSASEFKVQTAQSQRGRWSGVIVLGAQAAVTRTVRRYATAQLRAAKTPQAVERALVNAIGWPSR